MYYVQSEKGSPETRTRAKGCPALVVAVPCTSGRGTLHFLAKKCLTHQQGIVENQCTFMGKRAGYGAHI